MANYRLSEQAASDLRKIALQTIKMWGHDQAKRYMGSLHQALQNLSSDPQIGRKRDDIFINSRSFPVGKHIIFYQESSTGVDVARVLHQHMDTLDKFDL